MQLTTPNGRSLLVTRWKAFYKIRPASQRVLTCPTARNGEDECAAARWSVDCTCAPRIDANFRCLVLHFFSACSIRLKAIDADTDVPALADAIMKSCEIIPQNKQPLLVELLYELQLADTRSARRDAGAQPQAQPKPSKHARSESSGTSQRTNSAGVRSERGSDGKEPEASPSSGVSSGGAGSLVHHASSGLGDDVEEVPASVDQVEDYLEQLYEESAELKAAGAKKILSLALHPSNLLSLIENGTLMGALGRVLKDDYRKSTSLVRAAVMLWDDVTRVARTAPSLVMPTRCYCCKSGACL